MLQSIPVLGFLPGLVLALVALFPHSNTGLELACVLMIFTGQVWNMVFSYHDSLRAVPAEFRLLGKLYGFNWWHRFWRIELPCGAQGLLYNSMVSMAGGWFFLSITEAFRLGDQDFRRAGHRFVHERGHRTRRHSAPRFRGIIAMGVIIVVVDRLIWWPLVVWSRRFKLDDFAGAAVAPSAFNSGSPARAWPAGRRDSLEKLRRRFLTLPERPSAVAADRRSRTPTGPPLGVPRFLSALLLVSLALGRALGWRCCSARCRPTDWREILYCTVVSFGRVLAAVALGTLWTVPVGIWIGLNPRCRAGCSPSSSSPRPFPRRCFIRGFSRWCFSPAAPCNGARSC